MPGGGEGGEAVDGVGVCGATAEMVEPRKRGRLAQLKTAQRVQNDHHQYGILHYLQVAVAGWPHQPSSPFW